MTTPACRSIELHVRPSLIFQGVVFIAALCGATGILQIAQVTLDLAAATMASLAWFALAVLVVMRYRQQAFRVISLNDRRILLNGADCDLLEDLSFHPWLLIFQLQDSSSGRSHFIMIFPDSLPAGQRRLLRKVLLSRS